MSQNEFIELGEKAALVCTDAATLEALRPTLQDLGYKVHTADSADYAIERIRYNSYDIVVIHENFGGSTIQTNAVLNFLAWLPMSQRRFSFTCLIGPSFTTLDAMQAFGRSVHLVVNPFDVGSLGPILKKAALEFRDLYAVFRETRNSQGER